MPPGRELVPSLTAAGLYVVLPIVAAYSLILPLSARRLKKERERRRRRRELPFERSPSRLEKSVTRLSLRTRRIIVVVLVVLAAVLCFGPPVLFLPAFPAAIIGFVTVIAWTVLTRVIQLRTGRLTLWSAWPMLLVLFAYVLALGGAATELPQARYQFGTGVAVDDGPYLHLADDGRRTFLWSCERRQTVTVRSDDVITETFLRPTSPPTHPSLWDIVVNERDIGWGVRLRCT